MKSYMHIEHCIIYFLQSSFTMDSFYELLYMESSIQLLNLHEEISKMQKEREDLEKTIKIKEEEVELATKNMCWLKIANQKMGAKKYSPKKQGLFLPSPKKCLPLAMVSSPKSSSCSVHPIPAAGYATALVTSLPLSPVMPSNVHGSCSRIYDINCS